MSLLEYLNASVTTFVADLPVIACTPDHIGLRTESGEVYAFYMQEMLREGATLLRSSNVNGREVSVFTLPQPFLWFAYVEVAQPKDGEELYTGVEHVWYISSTLDELYQSYWAEADEHIMINKLKECHWIRYFKITYDGKELEFREASLLVA